MAKKGNYKYESDENIERGETLGGSPFLIRAGIVIAVLVEILVLAGSVSAATIYVNGSNTGRDTIQKGINNASIKLDL